MGCIGLSLQSKTSAGLSCQSSKTSASIAQTQQSKPSATTIPSGESNASSTNSSVPPISSEASAVNKDAVSLTLKSSNKDPSSHSQAKDLSEASSVGATDSTSKSRNEISAPVPPSLISAQNKSCEKSQETSGVKEDTNKEVASNKAGTSTEKQCDQTSVSKESAKSEPSRDDKKESANKGGSSSGYVEADYLCLS